MPRLENDAHNRQIDFEIVRGLAYVATGEWRIGEQPWMPPDDFLDGDMEPRSPILPSNLGSIALRGSLEKAAA